MPVREGRFSRSLNTPPMLDAMVGNAFVEEFTDCCLRRPVGRRDRIECLHGLILDLGIHSEMWADGFRGRVREIVQ